MKAVLTVLITFLLLLAQPLLAAPPDIKPTGKAVAVLPNIKNPAGLQALESFAGKDRTGKDGPMSRLGMDLSLVYQEHRNFKMEGVSFYCSTPSSLP